MSKLSVIRCIVATAFPPRSSRRLCGCISAFRVRRDGSVALVEHETRDAGADLIFHAAVDMANWLQVAMGSLSELAMLCSGDAGYADSGRDW